MALLFLAAASTVNSFLFVRMTNQAREKFMNDNRYIWLYFAVLALGWLDVLIILKVSESLIHHSQLR